jgi:mannitol-1-phosphate 5-dehydrogenase
MMPLMSRRGCFVVFGFGPIGAGLFLHEAVRSRAFSRLVAAEVLQNVVDSVREAGGTFRINVAHADRVQAVEVGPVEMENPLEERDRERLIGAIAEASEIATAVPSTRFYTSGGDAGIHRILAAGLSARRGSPTVVYAAENQNRAASALEDAVLAEVPAAGRDRVRDRTRFVDTVIGKMSAVLADPDAIEEAGLATMTHRDPRAFLVESFNRILVSSRRFPALPGDVEFQSGFPSFEEKADLEPFEEAKLHGHNAAHALAAYLAAHLGLVRLEEIRRVPGAVDLVRAAFLEESGRALIEKWGGVDPLFTEEGMRAHVDDLIERMLNPHLGDLVERIARDPARKLGWNDRLVGAMRLALSRGIRPARFAVGAAAALAALRPGALEGGFDPAGVLVPIWAPDSPGPGESDAVLALVREAIPILRRSLAAGTFSGI